MWDKPIARALVRAFITIFLVTTLNFVLIRLMPGNAVDNYIQQIMQEQLLSYEDAKQQASSLFQLDLNAPIHEQYFKFLGGLLRGDLGNSMLSQGTPVFSIIRLAKAREASLESQYQAAANSMPCSGAGPIAFTSTS